MNKQQRKILDKFLEQNKEFYIVDEEVCLTKNYFLEDESKIARWLRRCTAVRADCLLYDNTAYYLCEVNKSLDARTFGQILIDRYLALQDKKFVKYSKLNFCVIVEQAEAFIKRLCEIYKVRVFQVE